MNENQYQCDDCGGIFDKTWSDDEAKEEFAQNFGRAKHQDDAIVCDDCYNEIMERAKRTFASPK